MSEVLGAMFKALLGLLGIAAVAGVLYAAFGNNKTSDAISQQTLLQSAIQGAYSGQGTFTSLTNAGIMAGNLAPAKMVVGGALVNAWGGAVNNAVDPANAAQFISTNAGVLKDGCQKFAVSQSNAVAVTINGAAQTLPLEAGAVLTACNSATNTVAFTYAR